MYGPRAGESVQQPNFAIYVLWLIWFLSWLGAALLTNGTKRLNLAQDVLYRMMVIVGSVTMLFGFLPDPGFDVRNTLWQPVTGAAGWVLVAVVLVAFCVAWLARIRLGFHLPGSTRTPDLFIEAGPYKWVRHPVYACLIVGAVATALMFGRPSSLGGAVLLAIAFVVRIHFEESALRSETGSYDDYAERVPMLVPFLNTKLRGERFTPSVPPSPPRANEEKPATNDLVPSELAGDPVAAAGPQLAVPLTPSVSDDTTEPKVAPAETPTQPELSEAMSITKR